MWRKIFGGSPRETSSNMSNTNPLYNRLDPQRMPRHVAIIMDGNGRWATGRGLLRTAGHRAGVDALKQILKAAIDLHIEALTVYAFSTENWKRPQAEVEFLMKLFYDYLAKEIDEMDEDDVRLRFLGRIEELSPKLRELAHVAAQRMQDNRGVQFNVAMNYGGQDEILRMTRSLAAKAAEGTLDAAAIDEQMIAAALDTAGLPPVDLVIRTSGDLRLSNFLLWQAAYAEFWFTKTNWPDFTPACFVEALEDFQKRDRRFGGIKNK